MVDNYRFFRCSIREGTLVVEITEPRLHRDLMEDQLRKDLFDAWRQSRARAVVLDFSQVRFLTSAALRALLLLRREVLSQGGKLALCGLNDESVLRVFTTTRLVTTSGSTPSLLTHYRDLTEALAQLSSTTAESSETPPQ